MEMTGIATNFGSWVFTKYNKKDEMLSNNRSPFNISQFIDIMDLNDCRIREYELQKLVLTLDILCNYNK